MNNRLPEHINPNGAYYSRKRARAKKNAILFFFFIALFASVFGISYFTARNNRAASSVAAITIGNLDKRGDLEVLKIRASEVIIDNAYENAQRIDAWTECTGSGTFILDIANSEFVVDQARRIVIVRTPDVVLSDNFTLDYGEIRELFFSNNWSDDSYKDGADLAESQLKRAYTKILDTISENPYYYETARDSAERIVISLIKGFNRDIKDLQVIVEVGAL